MADLLFWNEEHCLCGEGFRPPLWEAAALADVLPSKARRSTGEEPLAGEDPRVAAVFLRSAGELPRTGDGTRPDPVAGLPPERGSPSAA